MFQLDDSFQELIVLGYTTHYLDLSLIINPPVFFGKLDIHALIDDF